MDKLIETAITLARDQWGSAALFFVAACALGLFAWHQHLRLSRHREDLERERRDAQQARAELERLATRPADLADAPADRRRGAARQATSRVLVVEDNDEMQLIIPAMLAKCLSSPQVKVSASPSEAVEEIDRFNPELLILDMNLGTHSGLEVLAYLKRTRPELPVLIYTGYEDQVTRVLELRRQTGLANLTVLHKGPDIDAFVHLVPRLFRRRASDQARTEGTSAPASERDRRVQPERRDRRQPAPAGVRERRRAAWPRGGGAIPVSTTPLK